MKRRLDALSDRQPRGRGQVPEALAEGLRGDRALSEAFEDPEELDNAEDVVVSAVTTDKRGEIEAVETVLAQLRAAIELGGTPAKWVEAERLMAQHGIAPGQGQLLMFWDSPFFAH